jgi:hypothetical protein
LRNPIRLPLRGASQNRPSPRSMAATFPFARADAT